MDTRFSGHTTIDEIVQHDPSLSRVLHARGIDTCCGGGTTLADSARNSGVPLEELLQALRSATESTAGKTAAQPDQGSSEPADRTHSTRFAPFLIASLLFALTFGATLGACLLISLTVSANFLHGLSLAAVKTAHGYAQVFGFATLFIMGVAYHTLPRFKKTALATPRLVALSFWLETAGVLLVAVGVLARPPLGEPAWLLGTSCLLGAALAFGWTALRTLAGGAPLASGVDWYLRAGCIWLIGATALAVAAAAAVGPALQPAVWEAALWGFAACFLFGMSFRILPVFLGVPPSHGSRSVFVLYQTAVLAWVGVAVAEAWLFVPIARAVAGGMLACAATAVILQLGIFGPRQQTRHAADGGHEKFIIAAYVWLLAALVFGPGWTAIVAGSAGGVPFPLLDFARHAFALGFLTQMIIGVATRIVPVFTGRRLWNRTWREATFYLLNAAVLARGLQVVGQLFGASAVWSYVVLSGPLGVAAFVTFALNVFMTMRSRRTQPAVISTPESSSAWPHADMLVSALLEIPGALDLLADNGFAPLRNPTLRAAVAETVTLRQACRMHGLAEEPLVARLRALAAAHPASPSHLTDSRRPPDGGQQ